MGSGPWTPPPLDPPMIDPPTIKSAGRAEKRYMQIIMITKFSEGFSNNFTTVNQRF